MTEISPNMNLPIPEVSETDGPDWAENINACMTAIDSHNHSPGQGVPITPDGININADLPMNGNNLTTANSLGMSALLAAVTSLLRTLQVVGVDLYYIDGSGNAVRITQSGSVTGSSGTITGLPSGTASASFAAGTYTFESATNTPAAMSVGPTRIAAQSAGAFGVTISPSASQPANYTLVPPLALAAGTFITDISGNMSFVPIGTSVTSGQVLSGLSTTAAGTLASISLSAGTWLLFGLATCVTNSGTDWAQICINTTGASFSGTTLGVNNISLFLNPSDQNGSGSIAGYLVTPGGTTTYYLNGINGTSASTAFYCSLRGVRIG